MSEKTGVRERIAGIFRDHLHLELPDENIDLLETGVLDSMAFVELLVRLEETFGIAIPLDQIDIDHFRTSGRMADFVLSRRRALLETRSDAPRDAERAFVSPKDRG